jgi:capsule biosynthesis phosphatase
MNIFILCAGKGSRFDSIYPKPLNLIYGKPMIYHTIKSLNLHKVHEYNLYIIYNKRLESCNFKEILINMFPNLVLNFILIDYFTRGASESAYIGLQTVFTELNNNNILFIDNDTIYPDETYEYLNKNYESNFIFTNFNNEKDPIYSYVSVNKDNYIEYIKEKQKISDLICIGCYGFKNKDEFTNIFKIVLERNKKSNNEFYMSLIYEFLLNGTNYLKQHVLNITINKTISLGTPKQLIEDKDASTRIITSNKLRYVFDLDNTLVTYPVIPKDYSTVKPINKMINLVRKLKDDGHTIIIYTARRMQTHGHNIGSVIKDIGKITFATLDKFEIPYDELIFGKPLGDIYIDDRSYNPYDDRIYKLLGEYQLINDEIDNKLDNNKYNQIKCIDERITKRVNKNIGRGELFFYENLKGIKDLENIRELFVSYYGYNMSSIDSIDLNLEKINGIPVSYLYINKTYSLKLFKQLLNNLKEIHSIKLDNILDIDEYKLNYQLKLKRRFEDKSIYNFKEANQLYETINERLNEYLNINSKVNINEEKFKLKICSIIHGDFWFSNILLTYKDEYKFIDMKGLINDTETLSGDKTYDYAKILQSLYGFDSILYDKEIDYKYNNVFIEYFKEWLLENEPDINFVDVTNIAATLIFGVFHAYANLESNKKDKIVEMVKELLAI